MQRSSVWLLTVLCLLAAPPVQAQSTAAELTKVVRRAMEAYNNLDLDTARDQLEKAVQTAESSGVSGTALAKAYINLGVVYIAGFGDESSALNAFVSALRQDGSAAPDPLVSTPDVQRVYDQAKAQAGAGGSGAPGRGTPGYAEGNLDHIPAIEQLSQTALPIYVEVPDGVEVEVMTVFYRSLGMQEPKSTDLQPHDKGWAVLIPCTDVFEPSVEYFVVGYDDDGEQVANAGSPEVPVTVPVVNALSGRPPALPGQPAPTQCGGASECPPGMPGCSGSAGLGDTCRRDNECGEGLICEDNFCSMGEREDEGGDADAPRFFVEAGASLGFAYVGTGMKADESPPRSLVLDENGDPRPTDEALAVVKANGWDCKENVDPGTGQVTLKNCTVAVSQPGFVDTFALNGNVGYWVTPKLMVAAGLRMQLPGSSGKGALAGILLMARAGYLLTTPTSEGFHATVYGGAQFGQVQPQPPSETKVDGPFVLSGMGGVHAGARLGYRVVRNFGFVAGIEPQLQLPTILFNIDIKGGVELAF